MPSVPQIIRLRQRRREQGKSRPTSRLGRIGLVFSLLISFLVASIAIGITWGYTVLTRDLPPPEALPALLEPPNGQLLQPTQLYDRTGEHILVSIQSPAVEKREYVPIDGTDGKQLASSLIDATIATTDPQFWNHAGFQAENIRTSLGPGQSWQMTLAERLVSDLLLWDEPSSIRRNLRVQLLAAQITARFGREKVIEWYLNSASYGRFNYGVQAAAQAYFGKPASKITLAEAAILAAAAETPTLNPHDSPQGIQERYIEVLQSMLEQGLIEEEQFQQAKQENTTFKPPGEPIFDLAPAFSNLVLEQLTERFERERILRGGLRIITSLDYDLQIQSECAAANQMARLEDPQSSEVMTPNGNACLAARLLPTISTTNRGKTAEVSSNIVITNPKNGQVLTMVGETTSGLDPAHLPGHPPGSLITPLIYLTGFSRGLSPASLLWDVPFVLPDDSREITNPDNRFHGPVRLRIALANDYLVPASQVMHQMGVESILRTSQQLGVDSLSIIEGEEAYQLPFEAGEVTLLDMTQAFGVLANRGILTGVATSNGQTNGVTPISPVVVLQVRDTEGQIWLDCENLELQCDLQTRPVISDQLAYLMTHILSDETARWPSLGHPNPLEIGRPAAAKIGQLEQASEAWTIGYTPSLVAGVWLGSHTVDESQVPATSAAGLWHALLQYATRNTPVEDWVIPPGISSVNVCDPSGLLPTQECPVVVSEVFQAGNEPTHADNLFQTFQINRETGNLATIFTPPALIEEQVYMLVPPEAEDWARQTGLPTVPDNYDAINATTKPIETAQITSPQMFASVSGRVPILGSAEGPRFSAYRLQIGQGLNPENWIQISNDGEKPVHEGQLGMWDTGGLSGLYALQLLVVRGEQQVDTHTIQIRVDNQAPEVTIRYPEEGQRFKYPEEQVITFQGEASDNLGLAAVEFYIDGELINTLVAPPFAVPWGVAVGEHSLIIRAEDEAGNSTEAESKFQVEE